LELKGERLQDADIMIAAIALQHNLTLVTNNVNHFKRIKNLRLENWM
jgi:predicted nucleic acid-binding protein